MVGCAQPRINGTKVTLKDSQYGTNGGSTPAHSTATAQTTLWACIQQGGRNFPRISNAILKTFSTERAAAEESCWSGWTKT